MPIKLTNFVFQSLGKVNANNKMSTSTNKSLAVNIVIHIDTEVQICCEDLVPVYLTFI